MADPEICAARPVLASVASSGSGASSLLLHYKAIHSTIRHWLQHSYWTEITLWVKNLQRVRGNNEYRFFGPLDGLIVFLGALSSRLYFRSNTEFQALFVKSMSVLQQNFTKSKIKYVDVSVYKQYSWYQSGAATICRHRTENV